MTPGAEKPPAPRRSAKGEKNAQEKFERQAAALRANLRRRQQQRRGQEDAAPNDDEADRE